MEHTKHGECPACDTIVEVDNKDACKSEEDDAYKEMPIALVAKKSEVVTTHTLHKCLPASHDDNDFTWE